MKGYRFYEEFETKKKRESSGNAVAIFLPTQVKSRMLTKCYEAVAGIFFRSNSPCCFASVSPGYLTERCKRVSEARAREIHPKLFEYLENRGG